MSLLGLFLFASIYWLLRRSEKLILTINVKKTAALLCVIPLIIYALIAGAQTPVVRSLIMSLIVIIAICSDRKQSFFTLAACAALLILAFSPSDLFTPSFQLTFSAVLSIASIVPILKYLCSSEPEKGNVGQNALNRTRTWLISAIGVSLAATLGTAPLLLYHFNRLSLVGPLANLIIEPLICFWSLTVGFVAAIFIFIFPPVAVMLFKVGSIGLVIATKSVYFFNSFAFSSVRLPTPSILQIVIYYLCLIPILRYHLFSRRIRLFSLICLSLSLLLFCVSPTELTKHIKRDSTVAILDVGHGSSNVVELPLGQRILIDGGALSSPNFDIGERVIAPFLWKKGITRIDDIVITHPDSDHYNGIPFILQHFGVKRLWINGTDETGPSWQHVLEIAEKNDVSVLIPSEGDFINCSSGACVQVLANTGDKSTERIAAIKNEESLILKFTHGDFSAIFPGDITVNIEKKLIEKKLDLEASLLLAAHHGSKTSNSKVFLEAVSPRYLAISARSYESEKFPAAELSSNCNEFGITTLHTGTSGTITITSTGKDYTLDTYLSLKPD
jgi:competence protein ComEC